MRYAVFADLSRRLTDTERSSLAEALDSSVPHGGCVGPRRDLGDEVYFCVEAISEEEARSQAARYMDIVLSETGLDAEHTLTLQRINRG